jgi:predicted dehydrogenase
MTNGTSSDTPSATVGVAMLGHGFMGGVHSRALRAIGSSTWPVVAAPRLLLISGRDPESLEDARRRYGWERGCVDWREQVEDPRVDLFLNVGPTPLHVEPTLEALRVGKHVFCEKPLAHGADEAYELWAAASSAGVANACGFNYRFIPAVALAQQLIARGELGEILSFRSRYFVPNTPSRGADIPDSSVSRADDATRNVACHHVDAARFLVGEIASVAGHLSSAAPDFEPGDGSEWGIQALLAFDNGASGTVEAAMVATLPAVDSVIEVAGSRASIRFSLQALNFLEVSTRNGVRLVAANDLDDPFMEHWYPFGHPIGWADSFTNELDNLVRVVAAEPGVAIRYATFEDGYRCAELCDAIFESARSGRRIDVQYRPQPPVADGASGLAAR